MLQRFIEEYGYVAVFVGCFLEGETILVLGGFAAYLGYLSLPAVAAIAALGGFLGDETAFFVGRRYGERLVARFPALARARPYVREKLDRYGAWVVFFIRFAIGLRVASPIVIGASGMHVSRFTPPNALGAIVWATLIAGAGYAFGTAFTAVLQHAKRYEAIAFAAIAAVVLIVAAWRRHRAIRLEEQARERSGRAAGDAVE